MRATARASGGGSDLGGGAMVGEYSSGLASAGGGTGTLTGVNSGSGAGGGLPSTTGLGTGGGGLGGTAGLGGAGAHIPGGGSLSRPVSLGMALQHQRPVIRSGLSQGHQEDDRAGRQETANVLPAGLSSGRYSSFTVNARSPRLGASASTSQVTR